MPRFIDIFQPLRPYVPQVLPATQEVDKSIVGRVVYREKAVSAGKGRRPLPCPAARVLQRPRSARPARARAPGRL